MAKVPRDKPKNLGEKLKKIRLTLGMSQNEMLRALEVSDASYRSAISGYELGTKEPSLLILLRYARIAGISTDVLIDDNLNLP
jgi:transcriptional regulator with XRE-family HTH domain